MTEEQKKYYMSLNIAVSRIIHFIRDKDSECSETFFSDRKGVYFETDMGYFIQGLVGLADALDELLIEGD